MSIYLWHSNLLVTRLKMVGLVVPAVEAGASMDEYAGNVASLPSLGISGGAGGEHPGGLVAKSVRGHRRAVAMLLRSDSTL